MCLDLVQMGTIKISAFVDESAWDELESIAAESKEDVSVVLTHAISEYAQRRRVHLDALKHLENSIEENRELGKLLAE